MITDIKNDRYRKKLEIFAREICPLCKICGKLPIPEMCLFYWLNNGDVFVSKILARIMYLNSTAPTLYRQIKTYSGFVSIFCSPHVCPAYTYNCISDVSISMGCYEIFLSQAEKTLTMVEKNRLLRKYVGKNLNDVKSGMPALNTTYELGTKHYLAGINKKKRKRFKKRTNNARIRIAQVDYGKANGGYNQYCDPWFSGSEEIWKSGKFQTSGNRSMTTPVIDHRNKTKKNAKKTLVTTTTFSNENDEGWKNEIDGYLNDE